MAVFDMNKTKNVSMTIYSLPIASYLEVQGEWETTMGQEDDPVFCFAQRPDHQRRMHPGRFKDAFALREQLFAVKNGDDVLSFFREYGPYQLEKPLASAHPVTLSFVLQKRDFYLNALLRPIESGRVYSGDSAGEGLKDIYLWQNLPMELVFRQPMQAFVRCKDIEDALRASVFLDRLRAMPWRRCMREDCGKPFEVPSRRAKIYCSQECAHLQSVRFYNKRQQAAKPAKKRGKG